jgi:phosphopantothenoylcysteine decarboxylase / phosphopantothenate---cysteine ligase
MKPFEGKKILLGISGGIAAYKACWLIRDLQKFGAQVRVVLTPSATEFVSPLTLQALSGFEVRISRFDMEAERGMSHIELARWADYFLIAPATANTLAKLSQGMADDLLTTIYLASQAPCIVCPAMNQVMWSHPATQANITSLQARGVFIVEPEVGEQACGEYGAGRLPDSQDIIAFLQMLAVYNQLEGKTVLITAGPTQEAIDPVRYISNRSSGKMGFALARAAAIAGAKVLLVSGPVSLATPAGVHRINVETAQQMKDAVLQHLEKDNIVIGTAAVADYRIAEVAQQKIKKQSDSVQLEMLQNPDIIAEIAALKQAKMVMGFAAETENVLTYAKEKLRKKGLDYIVANEVGNGKAFGTDSNTVTLLGKEIEQRFETLPKEEIAVRIIAFIAQRLQNSSQ